MPAPMPTPPVAATTLLASLQPAQGNNAALNTLRQQALAKAQSQSWPTTTDEGWRQTPLKSLLNSTYTSSATAPVLPLAVLESFRLPTTAVAGSFVFVNGVFMPNLSTPAKQLPAGCRVLALAEALKRYPNRYNGFFEPVENVFHNVNTAQSTSGVVIDLDPKVQLRQPLEIINVLTGNSFVQPRHIVLLGANAQAEVVETTVSAKGSTAWENRVCQIYVEDNATLHHSQTLQALGQSHHTATTTVNLGHNSSYQRSTLLCGGAFMRQELALHFHSSKAKASLNGVTLASGKTLADSTCTLNHHACGCAAKVNQRHVVDDAAKTVFQGKFYVAPDAQQTDDAMLCRSLLLSADAEAFSKPELEIHADDVQCSHGNTCGSVDPNHLFYLQARGIDAATAQAMLVQGFVAEVFDGAAQKEFLTATAHRWLNQNAGA